MARSAICSSQEGRAILAPTSTSLFHRLKDAPITITGWGTGLDSHIPVERLISKTPIPPASGPRPHPAISIIRTMAVPRSPMGEQAPQGVEERKQAWLAA